MKNKFKKGASSFYIVAFSTLVLLIVATSFAAIIISEIERTSNDDLSQSAYDSALAGVEDAKLAFYNYRKCLAQGDSMSGDCSIIVTAMQSSDSGCDMVGMVLNRVRFGEVPIQETTVGSNPDESSGNNMHQAYTCVKMTTELRDVKSSTEDFKMTRVSFKDSSVASKVKTLEISWGASDDMDEGSLSFNNISGSNVVFPKASEGKSLATPPTIAVVLVQTSESFSFDQFNETNDSGQTNRGMVYLVPTNTEGNSGEDSEGNSKGAWNGSANYIDKTGFAKSNNRKTTNLPYKVYCDNGDLSEAQDGYACTATIELPDPVGGARNSSTFYIGVMVPYGGSVDYKYMLKCDEGEVCGETRQGDRTESTNVATLSGMQLEVDSTGRANDLYRRIETRLEPGGSEYSVKGALELFGDDDSGGGSDSGAGSSRKTLVKTDLVTSEYTNWD